MEKCILAMVNEEVVICRCVRKQQRKIRVDWRSMYHILTCPNTRDARSTGIHTAGTYLRMTKEQQFITPGASQQRRRKEMERLPSTPSVRKVKRCSNASLYIKNVQVSLISKKVQMYLLPIALGKSLPDDPHNDILMVESG